MASINNRYFTPATPLNINKTFTLLFSLSCVALILGIIFYSGSSTPSRNLCARTITPYDSSNTQLTNLQDIMELAIAGIPILNMFGASFYVFRNGHALGGKSHPFSSAEESEIEITDEEEDFSSQWLPESPPLTIEEVFGVESEEREKITHFLQTHRNEIEYLESGQYDFNVEAKCIERMDRKEFAKCKERQLPSHWKRVGSGTSKTTWIHKNLPDHIIKLFWNKDRQLVSEEPEIIKLANKSIIAHKFKHLEIPSTALIKRVDDYFLIQSFIKGGSYEKSISEIAAPFTPQAVHEFITLFQELKLCDLGLGLARSSQKNIAWKEKIIEIEGKLTTIPVIGLYDLNCPFHFSSEDWNNYYKNFIASHRCFPKERDEEAEGCKP